MGLYSRLISDEFRPKIVVGTVYLALLMDCMLITIVVPILPDYLIRIKESNDTVFLESSLNRSQVKNFSDLQTQQSYHEAFISNSIPLSMLMGSKSAAQIITNFCVGHLTYKIGYSIPLFIGFVIIVISSLMFAFSKSYWMLFCARALNGVGSGFSAISGLGLLAQTFPDNGARGKAIAFAFGGVALGIISGPVVGGFLYAFGGIAMPFLCLTFVALCVGAVQLVFLRPRLDKARPEHTNYRTLLSDFYIIITAFSIAISSLSFAMLEPALPLYMVENWGSSSAEQGMAFLPSSIAYLIGTNMFSIVSNKFGRWAIGMAGHLCIGIFALAIPFAQNVYHLIIPNSFLGLGLGLVDISMVPMLGHIVDLRHTKIYGSVYAIGESAGCLAFMLGPFFTGPIVKYFGFGTMMIVMSVTNLIMVPMMLIIKRLPDKVPEKDPHIDSVENTDTVVKNVDS